MVCTILKIEKIWIQSKLPIKDFKEDLKNRSNAAEIQTKLGRRAVSVFFENAIEIGDVVEPAIVADFRDVLVRFDQLPRSRSQPNLDQELLKGFARTFLDQTT